MACERHVSPGGRPDTPAHEPRACWTCPCIQTVQISRLGCGLLGGFMYPQSCLAAPRRSQSHLPPFPCANRQTNLNNRVDPNLSVLLGPTNDGWFRILVRGSLLARVGGTTQRAACLSSRRLRLAEPARPGQGGSLCLRRNERPAPRPPVPAGQSDGCNGHPLLLLHQQRVDVHRAARHFRHEGGKGRGGCAAGPCTRLQQFTGHCFAWSQLGWSCFSAAHPFPLPPVHDPVAAPGMHRSPTAHGHASTMPLSHTHAPAPTHATELQGGGSR